MPTIAVLLYVANLGLGVLVSLRVVSTKRIHVIHHVLYFFVFSSAAASMLVLWQGGGRWWPLCLTLLCLGLLPRYRGGTRPHAFLTTLGFLGHVFALT